MALSDMQVFNDEMYTTITETLDQQIDLFNAASRGAIQLKSARNAGNYAEEAFYQAFTTQSRRRDPSVDSAVTAQDLSQANHVSVKVGGANGPFAFDPGQFAWIQRSPEEAALVIGEQVAQAIMKDMLNTSVGCAQAAISNQGNLAYDGTAGTLDIGDLNSGAALFGDKAQDILAWVMYSKPYHDLLGTAITNSNDLFSFGSINVVQDGFGRPLIVADIPALYLDDTTDNYYTLGLVGGGIQVEDNGDFFSNVQTNNGQTNIGRTWQSEYSFNVKLKGYSWDKTNGGAAPTDTELFTGTNWDQVASYGKDTAGVMVTTL